MSLSQSAFLSNGNYQTVVGFLRKHYATRLGSNSIPERMDGRIQKTAQHFMTEVAKVHGVAKPVQQLDQEVIRESTRSLDEWLRRQDGGDTFSFNRPPPMAALVPPVIPKATTVSAAAYARPRVPATPTGVPAQSAQNVGASFEEVAALFGARPAASAAAAWPAPVEDEEENPVVLLKKAQKQREAELLGGRVDAAAPRIDIEELNPLPQSQPPPIRTAPLPQDYIIPQEPVVKYRNTEYNIFLTSSDRDWFKNRTENRYNFSVTFNPGNRTGYGYSPSVQERFRNIERIEFVKALVPTESLTQLIRSTNASTGTLTFNTDRLVNILSLPFVGLRIAEINNNGFSTNPREDNTFAMLQYDAAWNSNTVINPAYGSTVVGALSATGYAAMIPKFLKSQRVYEPTPLAGLQKLTIRMERHDGVILSNDPDVFSIRRICLSSKIYNAGIGIAATDNTTYSGGANEYIYIQTDVYFPGSAFSEGDLLNIQGYTVAATGSGTPADSTRVDFENYMNAPGALNVVAIAYVTGSGGGSTLTAGVNSAGYANVIIVRSRFPDPSTGATTRTGVALFGGSSTEEDELELRIRDQDSTAATAALINLSRQTHVVLRVITRDMDAAANIRPDNV